MTPSYTYALHFSLRLKTSLRLIMREECLNEIALLNLSASRCKNWYGKYNYTRF